MILELINKVLTVLFFMSVLNVLRHGYYFIQAYFTSTEEEPKKYMLSKMALIILSVSLAYIISVIFTGLKL